MQRSPVTETLNVISRQIDSARYTAKTIKGFRESLRAIVDDDKTWNNIETMARLIKELKTTIDEFM